jgi:hypothetical protein
VIVGGIAVIAFGGNRTTFDIDIIIGHRNLDYKKFSNYLQDNRFDASVNDMKNFDVKLHFSFFDEELMFRIDLKGI